MEDEENKPLINEENNFIADSSTPSSRYLGFLHNRTSTTTSFKCSHLFDNLVKENEEEPNIIAAVFVVAFDTHCGKCQLVN